MRRWKKNPPFHLSMKKYSPSSALAKHASLFSSPRLPRPKEKTSFFHEPNNDQKKPALRLLSSHVANRKAKAKRNLLLWLGTSTSPSSM